MGRYRSSSKFNKKKCAVLDCTTFGTAKNIVGLGYILRIYMCDLHFDIMFCNQLKKMRSDNEVREV